MTASEMVLISPFISIQQPQPNLEIQVVLYALVRGRICHKQHAIWTDPRDKSMEKQCIRPHYTDKERRR